MTDADRPQFAAMMAVLSQAFGMEVQKQKMQTFWNALVDLKLEALQYAVQESVKFELRFPVPAKLREYAGCYRPPVAYVDLSRTAIPEDCTSPEEALERIKDIFRQLNGKFGTSLSV